MRISLLLSAACVLSATIAASLPANAFVAWDDNQQAPWSGPGYYAYYLNGFEAGPFSSEADCQAAISAHAKQDLPRHGCGHFSSKKDYDDYFDLSDMPF